MSVKKMTRPHARRSARGFTFQLMPTSSSVVANPAKNAAGTIVETPAQLFWRVVANIARAERLYPTADDSEVSKNHQFADHGDESRGGRSLSPRLSTRL
jgi:hypothetical protein